MKDFLIDNQHYILLTIVIACIVLIIFATLTFVKSAKLTNSLLVNKFKVTDMNEMNTRDSAPLYTIVVSNNSMNTVSIGSLGFAHDGDFFNYRNECKAQLTDDNRELVILPRGSIKLRLYKEQLERDIFKQAKTKRLKTVYVYLIGLGGETYKAKAKVITKKMKASYKEYFAFREPEIMARFIAICNRKIELGAKLKLFEKIKYKSWSKRVTADIPSVKTPMELYDECPTDTPKESLIASPKRIKDCSLDNPTVPSPSANDKLETATLTTETATTETAATEVDNAEITTDETADSEVAIAAEKEELHKSYIND